jgi:hypothetical protein
MPKKPAKMGRPKLADSEKRELLIRVLVNEGEYEELQAEAKAVGVGVSTSVRLAALERARARRAK